MLQISDLSKVYRRRDEITVSALEEVTLSVARGEFVAVQGPSGSGKTTLLLACGGLLLPSAGTVEINGENLYRMSPDSRASLRAKEIGFVFQQFHLIPYLSILENVLAPSLAVSGADSLERARELIERLNLLDRIDHLPTELSTGERQRTALARALLNRPGLLLAVEPTGNLDPENSEIVLGCLAAFSKSGGAVLMVTHNTAAASRADRSMELKAGKLVDGE